MNFKGIITLTLLLTGLSVISSQTINAQNKKDIVRENDILRLENAALKLEVKKYKDDIHIKDSLTAELQKKYEEATAVPDEPEVQCENLTYTQEVTDSLLDLWNTHKSVSSLMEKEWTDSTYFKSNVPDSVYIERIKNMNSFITLPFNDIVKGYIIRYSEKMPATMSKILALCEFYMPIFEETFDRHNIPEELKVMAIIESAMNPLAESRAGAKGMWQFMYHTAKRYGLHIDSFVDERLDPIKSVDAAARYLKDSYKIFGDWNLAIASYNCGPGNVNKAIKRSGSRQFWDIWPYLPGETRGYVPAFVGALYTLNYHEEYNIKADAMQMPAHIDTFHVKKMLHLKQISEMTGAPLDILKKLNPQYKHEIIPGNEREYIVRIPSEYTNSFIENEDTLHTHKADVYFNPVTIKKIKEGGDGQRIIYKVKKGDYLGKIAIKYRTSVSKIKKWNNLKSDNIREGQKLIIYR